MTCACPRDVCPCANASPVARIVWSNAFANRTDTDASRRPIHVTRCTQPAVLAAPLSFRTSSNSACRINDKRTDANLASYTAICRTADSYSPNGNDTVPHSIAASTPAPTSVGQASNGCAQPAPPLVPLPVPVSMTMTMTKP